MVKVDIKEMDMTIIVLLLKHCRLDMASFLNLTFNFNYIASEIMV